VTAQTIANRLLEAEPDDLDPSAEVARMTTSQHPGITIDLEGSHWNVYKQWRGSQHFIGEIHYVDMANAPVEVMSPEARAHHEAHRWVSIAGFRDNETQECKTFDQAVQWIITVNAAKTALPLGRPVAEAVDPDDPIANVERFAQERSVPAETEITNLEGRRFRVQIVWDEAAGGTSYNAAGEPETEKLQPIVQFFDMTHANDPKYRSFKDKGQFVSSYYASTLVDRQPNMGLDLYGGEPVWQIDGRSMDMVINWVKEQVESRGYKLKDDLFGKTYEGLDPDDPELYAHPEKFTAQPSDEKIEGAIRRMLAPYYTRVTISKRPGMFANREMTQHNIPGQPGVVNRLPFTDSFIWTIHCNRDTPLPLSLVNRALRGYDLDWRQEVKHWFEKWASHAGLNLIKFEIYGRLRKDPTFQLETARLGPLKESEDPTPEQIIAHYTATTGWSTDLYNDLWKFHPYGVGYEVLDIKRGAYIVAQTYFPPEKDNFALRFKEFVQNWFEQKRIFPVKFVKLYSFKHARGEQWSTIATINVPWADPSLSEYTPPVEPGPDAPVEVGQA
jgi:hypothetical protein